VYSRSFFVVASRRVERYALADVPIAEHMNNKRPPTYHIITYGCQMNKRDSEIIASMLDRDGYCNVADIESADLVIFNTCSVRERAEQRLYGRVNSLVPLKRRRPEMLIAVGGCTSQKHGGKLLDYMPHVDLVFGTHTLYRLPELISEARRDSPVVCIEDKPRPMLSQAGYQSRAGGVSAWISVMEGCDNRCAYCVVPDTRGPERSRPPEYVLDEVRSAVAAGYVEFILLGQNVNSYGRGLEGQTDFAELLRRVDEIAGVRRIRFATSHPKDLSTRLVDAMASLDRVCEHVHLPLQSGSDRILDLMNRGYTVGTFEEKVARLRRAMPSIGLTTDIIVGFPGETSADFDATCAALDRIRFDGAYIFKYSDRPDTPAATMAGHIDQRLIQARHAELLDIQKGISAHRVRSMVGDSHEVLVESANGSRDETVLKGRTRNYKVATLPGPENLIGQEVAVRVTGVQGYTLQCAPIDPAPGIRDER